MAIFFKTFVILFLVFYIHYHALGDDCDMVEKLSSTELRNAYRYYKKNWNLHCMNVMKLDWELIWPEYVNPGYYTLLTADIMSPSLTKELNHIIGPFLRVEKGNSVLTKDGARKKIGLFSRFIYVYLTRYNHQKYLECLTPKGKAQVWFLKKLVLKKYGLTEENSFDIKDAAFVKFAFLYAVKRYMCNSYHRIYSLKMQFSYNQSLSELIHLMGLLSAWNFGSEEVDFINELHKNFIDLFNVLKLFPMDQEQLNFLRSASIPPIPVILKGFYSFEYENEDISNEKQDVSGFLTYLDVTYCPRFSVSFKGNN